MADLSEGFRMIDLFTSVGATHFDVTFVDIEGQKTGFRPAQSPRQLRNSLPHLLPVLDQRKQSLVIRPHAEASHLVQLDDLRHDQLAPLRAVSFLILATSPGNHQAWVAVKDLDRADAKDFARLLRKGTGADPSASGATRLAGTANYKTKYLPDFPLVHIVQAVPGRITSKATLEEGKLVAAPERLYVAHATPHRASSNGRHWPDYQRCVQGARPNHGNTGPDISRVDFFFAMMAAQRGHGVEDIASRLLEVSSKAKENGEAYARLTAENAIAAAERQRRSRA